MTKIVDSDDWRKAVEFHGHICPGLSIGFKAATAGLHSLRENRSEDEEIVAIVETNACGADAVQVLTGCTFGKGNFIFRDHGKNVYSFISRKTGKGVRVALKAGAFQPDERHLELIGKIRSEAANEDEKAEFKRIHTAKSMEILEKDSIELFDIKNVQEQMPEKAQIEPSKNCERCGEPTMSSKLQARDSSLLCRTCVGTDI